MRALQAGRLIFCGHERKAPMLSKGIAALGLVHKGVRWAASRLAKDETTRGIACRVWPACASLSGKDRIMKATIGLTVLALLLAVPAYAQDTDEARPGRADRQRQFQGPAGPRFRGGDAQLEAPGRYGQPARARRGLEDEDGVRPNRGPDVCPTCGAPWRQGQRQGAPRGPRMWGREAQGGDRGPGFGPRSGDLERPPGPPPGHWNRGGVGRDLQGRPGLGPRGPGFGRPPWVGDDDRPRDPVDAGRE